LSVNDKKGNAHGETRYEKVDTHVDPKPKAEQKKFIDGFFDGRTFIENYHIVYITQTTITTATICF